MDDKVETLAPSIVRKRGVNSGRASILPTWTPVFAVLGRFVAGESIQGIADDYELPYSSVVDAIRFELQQRPLFS
jgi:uncharacterized protein (DUF433 family)